MEKLRVSTRSREELVDITTMVEEAVRKSGVSSGLCVLYCPHTSAAVTINEGADPAVVRDLLMGLRRLIPRDWDFSHMEGNSDAHLKTSLVGPSETLLIQGGRVVLGTWQRIFFCEFDGPRDRNLYLKTIQDREQER